jgi:hypothetical protein
MWTLISLGTGAAFVYSVIATAGPQVFPASFISGSTFANPFAGVTNAPTVVVGTN